MPSQRGLVVQSFWGLRSFPLVPLDPLLFMLASFFIATSWPRLVLPPSLGGRARRFSPRGLCSSPVTSGRILRLLPWLRLCGGLLGRFRGYRDRRGPD